MRHVFISYCREDIDFARTLETQIELTGRRVWRDVGVRAGEDWRAEIDRGIREALAVLLIHSPGSAKSAYVNYEWAFAVGSEIPVIALLYKPDTAINPILRRYLSIDLSASSPVKWRQLFECLEEIEDALRPAAALVPEGAPPAIRAAAQSLDSLDLGERDAAVASLAQTTHAYVVDVLAEAVRHPVKRVRQLAAAELARRQDARAVPAIFEALRGKQPLRPIITERTLTMVGPAAVPALKASLDCESDREWHPIVYQALGDIGGAAAIAVLETRLASPNVDDRYLAAIALGSKSPAALPVLIEFANGTDGERRLRVLYALSDFAASHKEQVVPIFIAAARDKGSEISSAGVRGLEATKDPAVIPHLLESFFDAPYDPFLNSPARFALEKFGALSAAPLRETISHANPTVRVRSIQFLKILKDPEALPLFQRYIADPDRDVRLAAIRALGTDGAKDAVPSLIECLQDNDGAVVLAALWSLYEIGDARAVPALVEVLQTGYGEILRAATRVLDHIGPPSAPAVPFLIDTLSNSDSDIASTAADALETIGTRPAKTASRAWRQRKAQ